ncbi:hypothetical protein LUZ60_013003 [Juncus effusus]|nr:hypothetical protein LUZ60_013003 [Juncus effusus]
MEESQSIISTIKSSINGHDRASAAAIQALSFIVGSSTNEEGLSVVSSVLSEDLVLSLARCRKYAVRSRVLDLLVGIVRKLKKGGCRVLRDEFMIRVFVGFTGDIYPILRRNGVEGLCEVLSVAGNGVAFCVVEKCCQRFVGLLKDDDELVRSSAVKLVGLCGEITAQSENEDNKSERINTIFIHICSMCRDLSKKVRMESFKALGKLNLVSESILMQSLSKKLLKPKTGDKKSIIKSEKEKEVEFKHAFLCGAGAFIHGIEDEFYEVRLEACKSLGKLALFCTKFADGALNLLMDLINDDYELIRLEALNSISNMATRGFLNMQEKHSEMFEGLLMDCSRAVRNSARRIIGLIKFPKFEKFKSIFNELITNLEKHPNEEEGIFLTLFSLGKSHTKFSLKLSKDLIKQIEQSNKEELILDKPGVSCTIVLSISSPFHNHNNNQIACDVPAVLFTYAVPLFSRISKALKKIINPDSLLSFLLERSGLKMECNDLVVKDENNEGLNDEFKEFVELILKNIGEIWPLIKSRMAFDVQRIMRYILPFFIFKLFIFIYLFIYLFLCRGCIEELEMLYLDEDNSTGAIVELILQKIGLLS